MSILRATCLVTCLLVLSGPATAAPPPAVLIVLDKDNKVTVKLADPDKVEERGLLVWTDPDGGERWEVVKPGWKRPTPAELVARRKQSSEGTRGASSGADGGGAGQFTMQFEQVGTTGGFRDLDAYFLTPDSGEQLLDPRPVFRRAARSPGWLFVRSPYPAGTAPLTSRELAAPLNVTFAEGQKQVAFADVKGLPKDLALGLPVGQYNIGNVTFTVMEPEKSEPILAPVLRIGELAGETSPIALEFAINHLRDYPSSALAQLEKVKPESLTPHLRAYHKWLLEYLAAGKEDREKARSASASPGAATGIEEIDEARKQIAEAEWDKALKTLDGQGLRDKAAADKRVAGLAATYRGVVLSETGAGKEEEARAAFQEAVTALAAAPPADLFRAYVNFGNFLKQRANDRFNDRTLQMAARVERPILNTLGDWMAARDQYDKALSLAKRLPGAEPGVEINRASLYALLADVIRALAPTTKDAPGFGEGEQAAAARAKELAKQGADGTKEPLLRGIAYDVRALVDFRAGDYAAAEEAEGLALAAYLEGGHLAGAENVYRLLGLIARRSGKPTAAADALARLEVAQLISESLRSRFPPDKAGLGRAGYFARKAYVNEMMVELLLEQKKPLQALQQLELAKARGLQDLLAPQNVRPSRLADPESKLLAKWVPGAAAVEYFLGSETGYVFVVGTDGSVSASLIRDEKGDPVKPRDLIADVNRVVHDMEGQAGKMFERLVDGQGYDNGWEDDMARLRGELLPREALDKLRGAKVVVVVPQHILHYFPFAALVIEKDPNRSKKKMAKPARMLIDEPFDLVYAPSLSAWSLLRARKLAPINSVRAVGLVEAPGAPALEGVATDLKNLQEVFERRRLTVLTAEKARASAAQGLLDNPGLVFFGTHGINVADRPLDSHLLLLPEAGAPAGAAGELTAGGLFGRKKAIGADLIIMSACYSGLGDRSPMPGDDLYGLQRAFLQSGARTVISGLWDVYDGTAPELMRGLFERLEEGKPAASALAGTQRAFLKKLRDTGKDEPWLHPYFWAVYTAAGDDRTKMQK